jgi:hypothetical protein
MLYLDPKTGTLSTNPSPGAQEVACTPGVTAPIVVHCRVHGVYEAVSTVAAPAVRGRDQASIMAFVGSLLAAAARSCTRYRAWMRGVKGEVTRVLTAVPSPTYPVEAWREIGAVVGKRVPFMDALRALASLELPRSNARAASALPYAVVTLDPASGLVELQISGRVPPGHIRLSPNPLIVRCSTHGWEQVGTLPHISVLASHPISLDLAPVICADGVDTCAELRKRIEILTQHMPDPQAHDPTLPDAVRTMHYMRDMAASILRVTDDVGWLVAQVLSAELK